ncbi:phospho-acceptor domain-containing protein [Lutibacter oceani]|uniref:histidine kinase n=1 Tax=Lutibacter oceani TaxID=1853311 RepID=A0A3D9RVI8_9FLAO|nr:HAMP domain-containing sensor histidine kinase [Lutibacter oceani]REE83488.1 phospho-acceptor domain-containing protein [Lutibacter oceani]
MGKIEDNSNNYTNQLEDKIVELSVQLKVVSNKLKVVNNQNDKLISVLTHNLKNPIGIVYSFSDMILEDTENYDTEKLQKHLQIINNSSQYAIELLNSFSSFQRIKSQHVEYDFQLKNYTEVLNNVINNFNELVQAKNIEFVKNISAEPIILNIDEEKIGLALKNIINNAIRFSNENSKIKIEVVKNNNTINTIISDEGIGILESDLSKIFNEFFVVNTYDVNNKKCIGLGLSIAEKIIKQHAGEISVESIFNKGTTITITLPIN